MYTAFYGLKERPFALLPDPRFLFLGSSHREALAHLLYGIEAGEGFIEVTGQVGTGKTTLCRTLLDRVGPEVEVGFIFNPSPSETELLAAINREFGVPTAGRSRTELVEALNGFLLEKRAEGRRVLLVIDEAQNLEPEVLEQIRLLSNLETEREKLLQIVLIGQPELEEHLRRADLRQLRQRITVRWSLRPFDRRETAEYVRHRLRVAGADRGELFSPRALRRLYRESGGIPRVINALADRALLAGYSAQIGQIEARHVRRASRELLGEEDAGRGGLRIRLAQAALLLTVGLVVGLVLSGWQALMALRAEAPALPSVASRELPDAAVPSGLRQTLLGRSLDATVADAANALLAAWGYPRLVAAELDPNQLASAIAEVSPLRVLALRASHSQLLGLDAPALLELALEPAHRRYAALLGLSEAGDARIRIGERRFEIPAAELQRLWTGRAFLMWQNYESLPVLVAGMQGTAVRWLQARLTELAYLERGSASGQFDVTTVDAIRRFQTEHDLEVTGEVGPATLIALYQSLDYGGPRLRTPAEVS